MGIKGTVDIVKNITSRCLKLINLIFGGKKCNRLCLTVCHVSSF